MQLIRLLVSKTSQAVMLSEVEASLIFRRRQHKTQSEILRLRFAPLRMTKNNVLDRSSGDNPGDFRNQGFVAAARVCQCRGSL
jgi:hypothetical protein